MNIADVKEYFDSFKCEALTSREQNQVDILSFSSNIQNSTSLQEYLSQLPRPTVKGFRLFDKVLHQGEEYFIFGRRTSGYFDIRTLNGEKVNNGSVNYKKLKLIEKAKYYLTERRKAHSSPTLEVGVSCAEN